MSIGKNGRWALTPLSKRPPVSDPGMADVLALYQGAPVSVRTIVRGRVLLSNLAFVEKHVPASGTVVELGCGQGLFSNLLALRSPEREVVGIDLSEEKIRWAQTTVDNRSNIRFICQDILSMDLLECDAMAIVDVMYLLPAEVQRRVLGACREKLKPGGVLVWKAQETRPRWKYAWTYLQELAGTSIGLSKGKLERLCFMSRTEAVAALKDAGFNPQVVEMRTMRPYTDILYVATPR